MSFDRRRFLERNDQDPLCVRRPAPGLLPERCPHRGPLRPLASGLVAGRPACARSPEPFSSLESATRPAAAAERDGYVRAATIGEVISRWRPETHLYVMGDVGLEEAVLADLAAWLADRHWTVLLVEDASGQVYRDAEGRTHTGEDAIEFGTGQGIPKRQGFAAQVHPETGEPDGAILTLVLAQRALFYTGSQAQDRRGLGEAAFQGNLDRWAIEAMRARRRRRRGGPRDGRRTSMPPSRGRSRRRSRRGRGGSRTRASPCRSPRWRSPLSRRRRRPCKRAIPG